MSGERGAIDWIYSAAAPVAFGAAGLVARLGGATARERRERAGDLPAAPGPVVWLHAASAGEVGAAAQLAHLLRGAGYRFTAAYTATNQAGVTRAERVRAAEDLVALAPWDTPAALARAFARWRPAAVFLIETELWPGLIGAAHFRRVPVVAVSARIYPRDVARYRVIRPLLRATLRRLQLVVAQDATERARFLRIGVPADRCVVGGNLKHLDVDDAVMGAAALRGELHLPVGEPVVVCGSVHADEIEPLFAALDRGAGAVRRLIIAPRQCRDAAAIATAAGRRGWLAHARTAGPPPPAWRVLVLDTIGELGAAYGLATVAVVGGTFGPHGGHNLLEPIRSGAPVVFGPHTTHVAADAARLARATPAARVEGPASLAVRVAEWLADDALRAGVLAAQRAALPHARAVGARYRALLAPLLAEIEELRA